MNIRHYLLLSALGCALPALIAAAAPEYDFFIAANINRNYVIGSKIVTTNGVFRRDDAGAWQHVGYNDTGISAFAFDPRNPNAGFRYLPPPSAETTASTGGAIWLISTRTG